MAVNEEIGEFAKAYSIVQRDLGPLINFLSVSIGDREKVSETIG